MDLATIIGFLAGVVFIIFSVIMKGSAVTFVDSFAFMITVGGTMASMLISYPILRFINGIKSIKQVLKEDKIEEPDIIKIIIELASIARREGLLALEEKAEDVKDPFLKKGILLIIDGTESDLVRNVLETELTFIDNRHKKNHRFWEDMATYAPAWGMFGTLVGLINMLKYLEDPTTVGPNMSVALLTTLYGTLLANFIASPIATKLKEKTRREIATKELLIEGLLSIQAGENPRIIEEKLKAFLAPSIRDEIIDKVELGLEVGA